MKRKIKRAIDNQERRKTASSYGSICPLLQEPCIGFYCKWHIDHDFPFHDECALPLIGELAIKSGIKGRKNWPIGYQKPR